ncbi:MAG: acyl carrier protein [Myxococcales bacterium]|nr:acyl carrier protein [Myxococcales bacterium]MCB9732498.1 acyl carrier protein [Deltaproteobacteria bacterium]
MNENEILSLMKSSLDEVAPGWSKNIKEFGPQVRFRDMDVDSVQIMEMVGVIEEKCNCQFADEDLAQIAKVGDMIALVKKVAA